MEMIYKLADKLNAQVAGTRPVIEAGWIDAKTNRSQWQNCKT